MKLRKKIICSWVLLSMVNFTSIPVFAYDSNLLHRNLVESFESLEIKPAIAERLSTKVEKGEVLDSMNSKYDYLEPQIIRNEPGNYFEKTTYPDGSVKIAKITAGTFTGKISGGEYNSGTYWYTWNNARVLATWGAVTMSYRANFEGGKGFGRINKVYNDSVTTIGGLFKNKTLKIVRANATSTAKAKASLYIYFQGTSDIAASDVRLWLYVPYSGEAYAKISTLA